MYPYFVADAESQTRGRKKNRTANTHSGDAFTRREKAAEDYAIRQREKEKLMQLKQKLKEQQAHLDQLSQHMYVGSRHNFV